MKNKACLVSLVFGTFSLLAPNVYAERTAKTIAERSKKDAFSGFSVGVNLGANYGGGDIKVTEFPLGGSTKTDAGKLGFLGSANVGFGAFLTNEVYAGVELGAGYSNLKATKNSLSVVQDTFKTDIEMTLDFEASGRIGYLVGGNALPFIKVGGLYSKWESKSSSAGLGRGSKSKYTPGFLVGIGCDLAVSDNVTIGGEARYAKYSSFSYNQLNDIGQTTAKITIDPSLAAFFIRARYSF